MASSLIAVAYELTRRFPNLSQETVIRVVSDCLKRAPSGDVEVVEAVARARLKALSEGATARPERAEGDCASKDVSAS